MSSPLWLLMIFFPGLGDPVVMEPKSGFTSEAACEAQAERVNTLRTQNYAGCVRVRVPFGQRGGK